MSEKTKILIILICFVVSASFILFYSLQETPIADSPQKGNKAEEKIDLTKLEVEYKKAVKQIINDYETALQSIGPDMNIVNQGEIINQDSEIKKVNLEAISAEIIFNCKERLLALVVPPALKDFHLNLVLSFDKAENSLADRNVSDFLESLAILKAAKAEYNWLTTEE